MEEFRGFSNLPLQKLTTSKEVVDNPNFLQLVSSLEGSRSNFSLCAEEEEDLVHHEYEIKEQDRWLPLANGTLFVLASCCNLFLLKNL